MSNNRKCVSLPRICKPNVPLQCAMYGLKGLHLKLRGTKDYRVNKKPSATGIYFSKNFLLSVEKISETIRSERN